MTKADIVVVGGGIVGLATARELLHRRPGSEVVVLEKEDTVARHQTGRNSGVVHAGLYYRPGSLKARLCRRGKSLLETWGRERGIAHERCGKLVIATDQEEVPRLEALFERAKANGVDCRRIGPEESVEIEPHAKVVEAIHVPETGIVDYVAMCESLVDEIVELGGEVRCGARVDRMEESGSGATLEVDGDRIDANIAVNCGGLQSDRLAAARGVREDVRIVPFRGDYYELRPEARRFCRGLIYPVPDPDFPFLGVHLTRMIGGGVECGPNAVLALAREGYGRASFDLRDALQTLGWPGFRRLASRHWRMGFAEFRRSWSRRLFARALQKLVPEIQESDLVPAPAGNRAQALRRDGKLVDDFVVKTRGPLVHVVNAPSPAATASLAIAERIAEGALLDGISDAGDGGEG